MTKKDCNKNCSNCKNDCSSCRQYQEKAFELEVDEEMEQERLAQTWQKYRGWIIGGVAAILLFTAGTQIYRSWWQEVRLAESDVFENAVLLSHNKKFEEAEQGFQKLAESAHTGYKTLANMELAALFLQQGKKEQALETYKKVIDSTGKKEPLHFVALISYTGHQIDSANPKEMLDLLKPALDNTNFQGLATEIAVAYLQRNHDKKQAKELIQKALANPTLTEENQARLNHLASMMEE